MGAARTAGSSPPSRRSRPPRASASPADPSGPPPSGPGRRPDAAELPVAAERGGDDLLARARLRADVAADRGGALDDVVREPAEPLDLDLDDVAGLDRARVGGRAGEEQVARDEGDGPG